jgi:hypothetical protein
LDGDYLVDLVGNELWSLHIKVDELHGRWMLDDVASALVAQYPTDA